MLEKRITIKDVAREAGVSIATVSRYLNNNFLYMSEETKLRIEAVINRLNYQPNKLAQGLKGQSRTVAVVVVNIGYPFCVSIIRSISEVLNASGYSLMVCETGGDAERELSLLRSLLAQGVDAIIIQTNGDNNNFLERLAKTMPILLIDRQFSVPNAISVVTNNEQISRQLTERLFQEGYEHVFYVSEPLEGLSTREERHKGYLQACQAFQKIPQVIWVNRKNPESLLRCAESLKTQTCFPFAVYTANGLLMLELYPILSQMGFAIPEKMGLATFDEPDWVKITTPLLTCIRQPTTEMGQLAANTILERLRSENPQEQDESVRMIPSEILFSASTRLRPTGP
jgi:LacI family kdg operon repressor